MCYYNIKVLKSVWPFLSWGLQEANIRIDPNTFSSCISTHLIIVKENKVTLTYSTVWIALNSGLNNSLFKALLIHLFSSATLSLLQLPQNTRCIISYNWCHLHSTDWALVQNGVQKSAWANASPVCTLYDWIMRRNELLPHNWKYQKFCSVKDSIVGRNRENKQVWWWGWL